MTIDQIKSDINFLCGSTSASYLNADKIRNINIAYSDVARIIWESADGWQYDDTNKTDLPIATTTLVHAQQDYSIPTTAQRLLRVEVKDSGGHFRKLEQKDIHDIDIAMTEYQPGNGMPLFYDVFGRSVLLYPTPSSASVTPTAGLKLYFDRDVTEFATTASSASPGFATPFHRVLSYAASIDFTQDANQRQLFALQKSRLEQGLVNFYSKRNVERSASIRPRRKKFWRGLV